MRAAPRRHILVVDDDPEMRALLAACSPAAGFRVTEAVDGSAMHAILARTDIDLVLLDVGLPGLDGLSLLREIRCNRHVRVIIVSGRGELLDRSSAWRSRRRLCHRPFHPQEMVARVRSVCAVPRHDAAAKRHARRLRAPPAASVPSLPVQHLAQQLRQLVGTIGFAQQARARRPGRAVQLELGEIGREDRLQRRPLQDACRASATPSIPSGMTTSVNRRSTGSATRQASAAAGPSASSTR